MTHSRLLELGSLGQKSLATLCALNNDHAVELSYFSLARFKQLIEMAWLARSTASKDAFMLVFDQDADYDNHNFCWFKRQHLRFLYIDRVVVAPDARGQGIARALYQETLARARLQGYPLIGCEVNLEPPNPGSDAFHASMNFAEVGRGKVPSGKLVRYLARDLARDLARELTHQPTTSAQ